MNPDEDPTFFEKKYFVQHLYDAKTLNDKFSILEKEVKRTGFDGLLYTFIPKLSRLANDLQPVFQHSDSYSPFISEYLKYDYSRDDFVIRLIESGHLKTIDWWTQQQDSKLTEREKQVLKKAKDNFGITKGITIPTLNNDAGLAGVSVISFKKDYTNKRLNADTLTHLEKCSRQYHDHTLIHQDFRYKFILPILRTLTPKKVMLIKYLISGKPVRQISNHVEISTRYAEKLLIELRRQFGNITSNEFIYLLGMLNISEHLK